MISMILLALIFERSSRFPGADQSEVLKALEKRSCSVLEQVDVDRGRQLSAVMAFSLFDSSTAELLRTLPELRALELRDPAIGTFIPSHEWGKLINYQDSNINSISLLKNLSILNYPILFDSNETLSHIKNLPLLTDLCLRYPDQFIRHYARSQNVRVSGESQKSTVLVEGSQTRTVESSPLLLSGPAVSSLSEIKSLKKLKLVDILINNDSVSVFNNAMNENMLLYIHIEGKLVSSNTLLIMSKIDKLKSLLIYCIKSKRTRIYNEKLFDDRLEAPADKAALAKVKNESVRRYEEATELRGLISLAKLERLSLGLLDHKLSKSQRDEIGGLAALRELELYDVSGFGIDMGDDYSEMFARMKGLKKLSLVHVSYGRLGLSCLSYARGLESLALKVHQLSDENLLALPLLPSLRRIEISITGDGQRLTSAGLERFKSFPQLSELVIRGVDVDGKSLDQLRSSLPKTRVEITPQDAVKVKLRTRLDDFEEDQFHRSR